MHPVATIFICLIAALVVFAALGFKVVRHSETVVVERLGRYHRTLQSGINIIWPIVDRPRNIHQRHSEFGQNGRVFHYNRLSSRIDLREAVYDFPKQNVITKDNVAIMINALVYFQITDPMKAAYEISNLPDAIEKLTQTTLRNVIGELDFDESLVSRDTINKKLGLILDEATNKWGVKVSRVELQDIMPPPDVQQAMEKQMRAERDRRAQILTAEGSKGAAVLEAEGVRQSDINRAEGEKQAAILRAEGEAQAMERMAEAESAVIGRITQAFAGHAGDPAAYIIAIRYLESLKQIANGPNDKIIYMPYEATAILSSLGSIKGIFEQQKPV